MRGARGVVLLLVLAWAAGGEATDFETALAHHRHKDYDHAFAAFMELAEQGDVRAQANVGYYYDQGLAVRRNPEEAARWYRLAAEGGNVDAQYNLGAMYEAGEGVPRDYGEAYKWLRRAAAQGDRHAAVYVGLMFEEGLGREVDDVRAYAWFHVAAERGEPSAPERRARAGRRLTPAELEAARKLGERLLEETAPAP